MSYSTKIIEGYKGFHKTENGKIQCRNFEYLTDGLWNEHKGDVELCKSGFHYCKDMYEIFKYYKPFFNDNIFAKVEVEEGIYDDNKKQGTTKKIRIIEILNVTINEKIIGDEKYYYPELKF